MDGTSQARIDGVGNVFINRPQSVPVLVRRRGRL